jgi:hypothetical protein
MTDTGVEAPIRLNARVGAVALAVGAPLNLILHAQGDRLGPLAYAAWLVFSLGAACFCDEMGAGRPLNRAGLIAFAAAFCADTVALVGAGARPGARLLYAFCLLAALVLWSVAMMHRTRLVKAVGSAGATLGGVALALLLAAHLLLGAVTILGFSQLFAALDDPAKSAAGALVAVDATACIWALAVALLLWTGQLRDPSEGSANGA